MLPAYLCHQPDFQPCPPLLHLRNCQMGLVKKMSITPRHVRLCSCYRLPANFTPFLFRFKPQSRILSICSISFYLLIYFYWKNIIQYILVMVSLPPTPSRSSLSSHPSNFFLSLQIRNRQTKQINHNFFKKVKTHMCIHTCVYTRKSTLVSLEKFSLVYQQTSSQLFNSIQYQFDFSVVHSMYYYYYYYYNYYYHYYYYYYYYFNRVPHNEYNVVGLLYIPQHT